MHATTVKMNKLPSGHYMLKSLKTVSITDQISCWYIAQIHYSFLNMIADDCLYTKSKMNYISNLEVRDRGRYPSIRLLSMFTHHQTP